MPLFGSTKDALLVKHFSKELMRSIISVEVAYFKLSLEDSNITIYNESATKRYYSPIRLFALVNKEDTTMSDEDTGINVLQNVTFAFLRDDLKDIDLVAEEGDIIKFDERFYEIDNTKTTQYWMGRNDETLLLNTEGRGNYEFGYNITISCKTHLTRNSSLNLVEVRSGINTPASNYNIPKNL